LQNGTIFVTVNIEMKNTYINLMVQQMGKNQHVVSHDSKWAVKGENNNRFTKITNTQNEAITIARRIAKNQQSELFIHKKDGTIRDRDSFGNDPRNVKG
jgi:uncharacterized protein YdaT